ncbi:MAG: OmpA family protein [Bacteroidetes bacterium]|nr:OmpA family protein [Bacteroidota bacterium]
MKQAINFKSLFLFSIALIFTIIFIGGCKSYQHKEGFELQRELADDEDTLKRDIYITSTLPIDSADVNKLLMDVWRIETEKYPEEIKLYTRVFDSSGHFITNMAKPYLKDTTKNYWTGVTETLGKKLKKPPVPIDSFTVREFGANDSIPYNIVLSVDYSGSMSGVMSAIFEGTELFVDLKMKYDNIGLTSFNRELDIKVPLMNDKQQILNIYRSNRERNVGLFSAVNDAVWNCIDLLQNTSLEDPRVLVIFTDGDDNYSKQKIGDLIEKARANKIHIFAVAFGYSQDHNLKYMAQYTGGKFYKAYTKEELVSIFRDIYMSLRYYYLVTYKPPSYWGYHHVALTVNVPERKDTLFGYGEYDMSDKFKWEDIGSAFERPILFDFNKSDIKPESQPVIEEVADAMLSLEKIKIEIQGHTDNVGGMEFNQVLSERRANAVMEALIKLGVEPRRMRARGFGLTMPKVPNTTEENRAINRRTEFHILAK